MSNKQNLFEAGTSLEGNINSDCPMVVRGHLKGQISGPSLHIGTGGSVSGHVRVHEIRSDGSVEGKLEADYVLLAGEVKDGTAISASAIEVRRDSNAAFGRCEIVVGQIMDKAQAIAQARKATAAS